MKFFNFHGRNVLREFTKPVLLVKETSKPISQPSPEVKSTTVRVLHYRGVSYIQKIHWLQPSDGHAGNMHLDENNQVIKANGGWTMQNQQMGFLYKLYCIGWKQGSLECLPQVQHWLLRLFLNYRKGYTAGIEWRRQDSQD